MAAAAFATLSLSLLSWNTYFSPFCWAERMSGILQLCEAKRPSVVCLQEVLPQFLLQPGWAAWLDRHGYASSARAPEELAPYGALTLARRELQPRFEEVALPSRMGRKLLITHLETPRPGRQPDRWRIGNVHLESLDSAALRAEQLAIAGRALLLSSREEEKETAPVQAVLCGDFNFDSDRNFDPRPDVPLENDALATALPGFQDCWPLLHGPVDKGYTFDATVNTLLSRPRPDERMRYDRVMARCAQGWRPVGTELVGDRPTEESGRGSLFLSDHFGLLATFAPTTE